MIGAKLRRLYQEHRKAGWDARSSLRAARIRRQWRKLEWNGFVRLRAVEDDAFDPDDLACSCEDPHCLSGPDRIRDTIEHLGVWGTVAEFRLDATTSEDDPDSWEQADSCWGHIGYRDVLSPTENAYVIDHMAATIDAFAKAWRESCAAERHVARGACPHCRGTGVYQGA
jgi:hypothetical protein